MRTAATRALASGAPGQRVLRSCVPPLRRAALPALLLVGVGCTLTDEDFEPPLVESRSLAADAPEPAAPLTPSPSSMPAPLPLPIAACGGLTCPEGFDCVAAGAGGAAGCVPSACAESEPPESCVDSWCSDGSCAGDPCRDGLIGSGETDVDCGGACAPCPLGAVCSVDADCQRGGCVVGVCSEPTCSDGLRNGAELGADCGGGCGPCVEGEPCAVASDCRSGVCGACEAGGCCAPPSCEDGVVNGGESAVDCGGACGPCPLGAACVATEDCASNVCQGGLCSALCADGQRDGDESEVDCGGSELGCPRCADGRACAAGADCSSGRCDGVCISCTDGLENGDEAGLDCGSSELGCPACPRCDEETSVALGPVGSVTPLSADGCAMLARFAGYSPTLIESYAGGPFPVAFSWRQECTGLAGDAVFERQFQQIRIQGLGVSCPIFFDLGGGAEPLSLRWY